MALAAIGARQHRPFVVAVRDMDVAAEVIGIRLMRAKLLAFAAAAIAGWRAR